MAVKTNPQRNLPLCGSTPGVSIPKQAQVDATVALADLILQV